MTPEMRKKLEEKARKECALEEYPNSLWQRQGFMVGAQAYESLLAEMAEEDVEKGLDHPCRKTCSGWKQGYAHGYARAKEEKAARK